MRRFSLRMLLIGTFLTLMSSGLTYADSLSGCGSCFGNVYTLEYNPANTTTVGADTVYDLFLVIDTTGYNGTGDFINSVSVKIASSEDTPPSSLVAAPGGTGVWTFQGGGLNSSGCDGSGSGFLCAQDSNHAPVPFAGTYTWEFHYGTTGALLTGNLASDIKVLYTKDAAGLEQAGITSEGITLQTVPEPTSISFLGGAILGLGIITKKVIRARG